MLSDLKVSLVWAKNMNKNILTKVLGKYSALILVICDKLWNFVQTSVNFEAYINVEIQPLNVFNYILHESSYG